jgi:hypothetical protein
LAWFLWSGIGLFAYLGSILNRLKPDSWQFFALNFIGSALACIASWLISYWPFFILEGIWAISSLFGFVKLFICTKNSL